MEMTKEEILKLEAHKIAEDYPMADNDEFALLKDSIKKNGVQIPIVLYNGKILDGRNRHKAVVELYNEGWDKVVEFKEYSGKDAKQYADSLNLHRRHLTAQQKAVLAFKFYNAEFSKIQQEADVAKKNAKGEGNTKRAPSANQIFGEKVGVNHDYIGKMKIIRDAFANDSKALIILENKIFNKDINIVDAYKLAKIEDVDKRNRILTDCIYSGKSIIQLINDDKKPKDLNANMHNRVGLFFGFEVDAEIIRKIKSVLYDNGVIEQDFDIIVAKGELNEEKLTKLEELEEVIKDKMHPIRRIAIKKEQEQSNA